VGAHRVNGGARRSGIRPSPSGGNPREYRTERQDALRDDTRTGAPILIFDPEVGDFVRAAAFSRRGFRGDLLFSYQPGPGTVLFAGYGSTLEAPAAAGRAGLRRTADGFFLKLSYLSQM
jgi:hypothetical protein